MRQKVFSGHQDTQVCDLAKLARSSPRLVVLSGELLKSVSCPIKGVVIAGGIGVM